jgi:hypothetical protein
MTTPEPPPPPATVGTAPETAFAVNQLIGQHLRAFTQSKGVINQDHSWLDTVDLKAAPYYFAADQETLLKSAIADLDTALDGIDMTFISRIIGLA